MNGIAIEMEDVKIKIAKLAFEICQIPSVTGHESQVLDFLSTWLKEQGLLVEKIPVSEGRYNILAYWENRARFSAIFCTHVDTVAPFIAPHLDGPNEILWGRGSCDAKGIIAAMIMAILEQKARGFSDLALLLTVGEEEASDGAKACGSILKSRADYLVIGEPTELRAARGQKGSLVFDLIALGKEAHSSMPEEGESAIHKLIGDINALVMHPWPDDETFQKTLINIGTIEGGSMRNVLAGAAVAKGIMRTSSSNQRIIDTINSKLSPGVTLVVKSSESPFSYAVPEGFPEFLAGFGSDAPYLREVGQIMLLGPGSIRIAHKADEHITFLELYEGFLAYQRIAEQVRAA